MSYKGKEREWQSYDDDGAGANGEGDDDGEIIEQHRQHRNGDGEQERWDEDGQQEEEEDGEDDRQGHVKKEEQHEEDGRDLEGRPPPPEDPIPPREPWLPRHVLERPKPPTKEEREAEAALLEAQARAGQNTNDPRAKARGKVGCFLDIFVPSGQL